jgi:hypothetical protein
MKYQERFMGHVTCTGVMRNVNKFFCRILDDERFVVGAGPKWTDSSVLS